MKTPKRKTPYSVFCPHFFTWEGANDDAMSAQRWKRKNKTAQYKRTIEQLARKNDEVCSILKTVQRIIEVTLAKDTTEIEISFKWENAHGRKEATRKARLLRRAHRRACRAITAENAKQGNLLCADAEQLTERKEKE